MSPSTVHQLGNLIASLTLPSLISLYIGERLWDCGLSALFTEDSLPKLMNVEQLTFCGFVCLNALTIDTCVKDAFVSFLQYFKKDSFPVLQELKITGIKEFTFRHV